MNSFDRGIFAYDTHVTLYDGQPVHVEVILDVNHPQVRRLIHKAQANKAGMAIEAGGALKVRILS